MKKKLLNFALALGVVAGGAFLATDKVDAAVVTVNSQYRVVEVDTFEKKIGVALPDAKPTERQNWVFIKSDTKGSMRKTMGNGTFRDQNVTPEGIIKAAQSKIGGVMKIQGGRDLDGTINAEKVWW